MTIKSDSKPDTVEDPDYDVTFLAAIPCNIIPKTGGEKYRGHQLEATTTAVIECRWFDGLLPTMIAVNDHTGEIFNIRATIDVNGEQREWLIQATKVEV